ncbi:WD40 repeat domain-containing protein [Streptomyces sp. NPDC057238]|uniref:WD40 repeat domain-containing protein n=1 Tax=Streptomyces sp. NPDC057238 TaxID=3346060 RepID=UPI00362DDB34
MSFTGHFGAVKDLVPTTLGKREVLLSSGEDGAVRLWDPGAPPAVQRPTRFAGAITSLSVAHLPDGPVGTKAVVLVGNAGTTNVDPGHTLYFVPRRKDGEVTGVATVVLPVAGKSRILGVTCSTDETIRLFDLETGKAVGHPLGGIRMLTGGGYCQMPAITAGLPTGRSVVVTGWPAPTDSTATTRSMSSPRRTGTSACNCSMHRCSERSAALDVVSFG